MRHSIATIGRWESIRPPRGASLAALSRVAREFERQDLAEIFERELNREFGVVGGGLGAVALQSGMISLVPLESALKNLYEYAHADTSRSSTVYRAYQKMRKAIAGAHAVLVQEAAKGKVLKLGQPHYRQYLEGVQVQIAAMEDREESQP